MSLTVCSHSTKEDNEDLARFAMARFQALMESKTLEGKRLQELDRRASILIAAGVTLIPSEHLKDNEFVVSQEIYDAAKRLLR